MHSQPHPVRPEQSSQSRRARASRNKSQPVTTRHNQSHHLFPCRLFLSHPPFPLSRCFVSRSLPSHVFDSRFHPPICMLVHAARRGGRCKAETRSGCRQLISTRSGSLSNSAALHVSQDFAVHRYLVGHPLSCIMHCALCNVRFLCTVDSQCFQSRFCSSAECKYSTLKAALWVSCGRAQVPKQTISAPWAGRVPGHPSLIFAF